MSQLYHHKFLGTVFHHSPKLDAAMHEVFTNTPSTVRRANVSGERKRKMLIAIAYSKARKGT